MSVNAALRPAPAFRPAPPEYRGTRAAPAAPYSPAFALFVLLNFVLYVRPNETVPALYGLELYTAVILPCLLLALPLVVAGLEPRRLAAEPLVACVLALNVAVVLSQLANL